MRTLVASGMSLCSLMGAGTALGSGEPSTAASRPGAPAWTLLVYGAVDNSADGPFIEFMDQVRKAVDDDPGLEILVFIDRSQAHRKRTTYLGEDFTGARLYRLTKDSAQRLSGGAQFPELTAENDAELNSADAATLQRFIAWGKAQSQGRRHGLLIYSHANGATMCPDDEVGGDMGIAELTDKIGAEDRVDFLALELCQMGGLEIAYQWRPGTDRFGADVLLAIPNAGPPLDWDRAFARIRTPGHAPMDPKAGPAIDPASMSAPDFGRLVIEEGQLGRRISEKTAGKPSEESAGCYDLRLAPEVKSAVDALAVALAKAGSKETLLGARGSGPAGAVCYSGDGAYVDLYDLCRRLGRDGALSPEVRSAADRVMQATDRFVIASFGMGAYQGFEAGKNGVFIVLPSGAPGSWEKLRWYTPLPGSVHDFGRWSFLADGATQGNGTVENWFELLDTWFDKPGDDGGTNEYRP